MRTIKAITTALFDQNHMATNADDALKKAKLRAPNAGQNLLHYMSFTAITNVGNDYQRQFKKQLSAKVWQDPPPSIAPNNYTTVGKFVVWEYDKKKDSLATKKYKLCLGLFFTDKPAIDKVELGIHHLQGVS